MQPVKVDCKEIRVRKHFRKTDKFCRQSITCIHLLSCPLREIRIVHKVRDGTLKIVHRKPERIKIVPFQQTAREFPGAILPQRTFIDQSAAVLLVIIEQIIGYVPLVGIDNQSREIRQTIWGKHSRNLFKVVTVQIKVLQIGKVFKILIQFCKAISTYGKFAQLRKFADIWATR